MKKREISLQNKLITTILLIMIIIITGIELTACGTSHENGSAGADADAPYITACKAEGGCSGGENDQYIDVNLKFNKNISISSCDKAAEELRVVIGGERIKKENMIISQSEEAADQINIRISINKVTNGVLEITLANGEKWKSVTDESGGKPVEAVDIKKLIPSGVTVENTASSKAGEYPSWTEAEVKSVPNHRSMVWIQIFVNGVLVEPDDVSQPDVMDGAAGIHEHEFLWATEESVAEDIAKAVNDFYGERFEAQSSGSFVKITEKQDDVSDSSDEISSDKSRSIELRIYEY